MSAVSITPSGWHLRRPQAANLPVQQVTKVKFYINLNSAKALGLKLPESFLLRADEVID
jgi:putative ABC transport system substrate-binding protein